MLDAIVTQEFAALSGAYLNTPYLGPLPNRAAQRVRDMLGPLQNPVGFGHSQWRPLPDQLRQQLGHLLGLDPERVSHHGAVCEAISTVAAGFPFAPGDQVVLMQGDYPSDVLPWMAHEHRYERVMLPTEVFLDPGLLREALPPRTRVVCVSHVMFNTGTRLPIADIGKALRERDAFFVVDGSQSTGCLEITHEILSVVDVWTSVSYKWLLGGYGHAFAYWSPRAIASVRRTVANWQASVNGQGTHSLLEYTMDTLPGARRFDRGQTAAFLQLSALSGALEVLAEVGVAEIERHNRALVRELVTNLPAEITLVTPEHAQSCIVVVRLGSRDPHEVESALRAQGIDASVREGGLRVGLHFFNTHEHVHRLLECLDA